MGELQRYGGTPPAPPVEHRPDGAIIVNDTGLPDEAIFDAVAGHVQDTFVEYAGMTGGFDGIPFQMYAGSQNGSLLARKNFVAPRNVFEEVTLARDLADRDDDVRSTMGALINAAFKDRMQHHHADEKTVALFNKLAANARLDNRWKELYREYLIAGSVTTASFYGTRNMKFTLDGVDRMVNQSIVAPMFGVISAEQIRVVGNDIAGTAPLAYKPANEKQAAWLKELFNEDTTPARKAQMRSQDPALASLLVGRIRADDPRVIEDEKNPWGMNLSDEWFYILNPNMVQRTSMPKGADKYPRPLLTADFALLEAKRLLNVMDYALLQGGSNFIVVAKKGTDQLPAKGQEVANLAQVVKRASRTGVIVGDHRLSIEIITPDLKELLSEKKRGLLAKKIAQPLLRVTPPLVDEAGTEIGKLVVELIQNTVTGDRNDLIRHVENHIYDQVVDRNGNTFNRGAPTIWMPKVVMSGLDVFTDLILKLRDRGDIPRRFAVEAAGFPYDAAVEQRRREIARGDDEVMAMPDVPYSGSGTGNGSPGPQDNGGGRPRGARTGAGQGLRRRPTRVVTQNAGETVRAWLDDETGLVMRVGETTYAILEQYQDSRSEGRITTTERALLERGGVVNEQGLTIIPVNEEYAIDRLRAERLAPGLTMIVGYRESDNAVLARAICFREPEFSVQDAEETALKWGYPLLDTDDVLDDETASRSRRQLPAGAAEPQPIIVHVAGGQPVEMELVRDDDGRVTGSRPKPAEE